MVFKDLYDFAASLDVPFIRVKDIARRITANHDEVGEITFTPVVLDENTALGYVVYDYDRSSAYDNEFKIMGVRYSSDLNRCHRRFVCCKEIMHAFDSEEEQTTTRSKFFMLMRELESAPLQPSPMLSSENKAEWMALLILCPKPHRDALRSQWEFKQINDREIANKVFLPEWSIRPLMGEGYDQAFQALIG